MCARVCLFSKIKIETRKKKSLKFTLLTKKIKEEKKLLKVFVLYTQKFNLCYRIPEKKFKRIVYIQSFYVQCMCGGCLFTNN